MSQLALAHLLLQIKKKKKQYSKLKEKKRNIK